MQKGLSMAIIGAGISGLSLAASLMKHSSLSITIIEKQSRIGGRVYTSQVKQDVFADLGANIIDFQNKDQEKRVRSFLSDLNNRKNSKLHLFGQPFLIYERNQLRKGDYQKQRFYYENGFKQLISDIYVYVQTFKQRCCLLNNTQINSIERKQSKWLVRDDQQKISSQFDYVVFACNAHGMAEILKTSNSIPQNVQQFSNVKYTKQISLTFEVNQANYSSVLFKNHTVSFISSHIEKYPQQISLIVMQTSEAFSEKFFDEDEQRIQQQIRGVIPQFLEKDLGRCLKVKKWWPSLIRQKRAIRTNIVGSNNLFVIGDVITGASRVANAIESALFLSKHLHDKVEPSL